MFKVIITNAVVSKGYDKNPALNFSENGKSVRFRIGKGLYDPNAENNTRWLNKTVKAFDSVCERIKKMQLKEGSRINITGNLTLDVWTDNDSKEEKSAEAIIITDIEYATSGSGNGDKNEQGDKAAGKSDAQKPKSQNKPADEYIPEQSTFEGYESFGGTNAFFSED